MQKKGANISLKGYDDIFSTDQSRAEAQQERVQEIPLSELHPFEGHPFRVVDDEEMMKTAESVRDFGVLTPAIVRPDPDGGYEIVSGHRRHRASELAGKETMPAIVRDLDDDAAIILMVDANLQRESILPSERAFAYKMKLDAIKHQGQRTDLTSSQVGMKLQANGLMGVCDIIPKSSAKPGDLIFFQGTYDTSGASHVGIYVGNGMMIHCGNPISYASIESNYWQQHFYCFGRIRN